MLVRGVYQSNYTNTSTGACGCEGGTNFCDYLEGDNTTGSCIPCEEVETAGDCWLRFNSRDMGDRMYTRSLVFTPENWDIGITVLMPTQMGESSTHKGSSFTSVVLDYCRREVRSKLVSKGRAPQIYCIKELRYQLGRFHQAKHQ